jgi:microcystin degradation protein MlrC
VAPQVPLAVALDLHGNVTQAMVDAADVIVGFKTYPHVDMYETGAHAARLLFDWLAGGARPHVAWAQPPLLSHTLRSATGDGAMQRAVQRAQRMEADGLLAATVFAGFSLADFRDAGMSVVTVGRDRAGAQRAADELARQLWAERDGFVYAGEPLADSVARARAMRGGGRPVLLLDHGDNVMSGGTCDTTTLLEECLRQVMTRIGVGPLADGATVAQAFAAGVGSRIRVALGNKVPLGLPVPQPPPFACEATVRALGDGRFRIGGPIYTGETWTMGRTAVLAHDAFTVVVTEKPTEPLDPAVFTSVGVEPLEFDWLLLKSRMYCRPTFVPLAAALVECDSRGVCSSDYGLFRFTRLRRPVYPLDPQAAYGAP